MDQMIEKLFLPEPFLNTHTTPQVLLPKNNSSIIKTIRGDSNLKGELSRYTKVLKQVPDLHSYLIQPLGIAVLEFPKHYYTRRENFNTYMLLYTIAGKGILNYDKKIYELYPDDGFLIDCKDYHEYYAASSEGWSYAVVHLEGISMPWFLQQLKDRGSVKFTFGEKSPFRKNLMDLFELHMNQNEPEPLKNNSYLTNILTEMLSPVSEEDLLNFKKIPNNIRKIKDYLHNHYCDPICMDSLSEYFHLSKYHLSREFKRYIGVAPNQYLLDLRMERAKTLLCHSEYNISQIGQMVGIPNNNYFIVFFKKRENCTPSEYRIRMHGNE